MSEHRKSDDDLLAGAIPIDGLEEEDDVIDLSDDDIEQPRPKTSPAEAPPVEIDLAESDDDDSPAEIRMFGKTKAEKKAWKRQPNADGSGATHVRTFVAKLRMDAIEHLEDQVNEWLDAHPELEVKFVTSNVGILTGKTKEDALFMSVWV